MRILMMTSSYPVAGDPGWGPFIREHARAIRARGHEVTILTPSLGRGLQVYRDREGIRVVAYPYSPGTRPMLHCDQGILPSVKRSLLARAQLPGFLLAGIYYLVLSARKHRADVIHAHWFIPGGLAAAIAKPIVRLPLVTMGHGADFHLPNRRLVRRALAFVHRRSDVSLAVSEYIRDRAEMYGLPKSEIFVARNGVDTDAFRPGERDRDGAMVIGVARRLLPEKRVRDLIDALSGIPPGERKRISVRIAGEGSERRALEDRARRSGISRQVDFLGSIPHGEMPDFLRSVDLLVNPSVQEGLSAGILEGISTGLAVIACRGVGSDEVIEDGRTGLLYPPGDVGALRDSIRRALRSPRLLARIGTEARRRAVEDFSLARAGRDWEDAYRRALAAEGNGG